MRRRYRAQPGRSLRVNAFLLLAVFLTAGTSLPSLDAIVYHHQGADAAPWQTHVESAGDCLDHTQHCGLGRTAPGSSAVEGQAGTIRIEPVARSPRRRLLLQSSFYTYRGSTANPRAPPAPLA
jgi:hypothetical protein